MYSLRLWTVFPLHLTLNNLSRATKFIYQNIFLIHTLERYILQSIIFTREKATERDGEGQDLLKRA